MNKDQDIELIDRFLREELSPEEIDGFNTRLENDPDFKELYQFIKDVQVVTKEEGRRRIRNTVQELFDQEDKIAASMVEKPIISLFKQPYAIAASLIVLVATTIVLVLTLRTPSTENLITHTEQKTDSILTAGIQIDSLIKQAQPLSFHVLNAATIAGSEFGFVANDQPKTVPLVVKILATVKQPNSYILLSDTLILVGNFDINHVGSIYNLPRRYIADYNDTLYRIDKQDRVILPLEREFDLKVIQGIQEFNSEK